MLHVCGTSKPDENQADRYGPFRWNQLWLPFLSNKGKMIKLDKKCSNQPRSLLRMQTFGPENVNLWYNGM